MNNMHKKYRGELDVLNVIKKPEDGILKLD